MQNYRTLQTININRYASDIREKIFRQSLSSKTDIFLCGGSEKHHIRYKLSKLLENVAFYKYNLVFPEDIFDEMLSGASGYDLLKLENILADSVDVIIVLPESQGSIAELGAFTNHDTLRDKILCIQDTKHKKHKSFINNGPVKLLKASKKSEVVFIDYKHITQLNSGNKLTLFFDHELRKIVTAIKRISEKSEKKPKITNIIQTENFILPCIYLFEPIKRYSLIELVQTASEESDEIAEVATRSTLTSLIKQNIVTSTSQGYILTKSGLKKIQNLGYKSLSRYSYDVDIMDNIRADYLSSSLRGKKSYY